MKKLLTTEEFNQRLEGLTSEMQTVESVKVGVSVLSSSIKPIETLLGAWFQSRPSTYHKYYEHAGVDPYKALTLEDVEKVMQAMSELDGPEKLEAELVKVLSTDIPVKEAIHFTINYVGMSVAHREQLVRPRTNGHWIQSMRESEMTKFYEKGQFFKPDNLKRLGQDATDFYDQAMYVLQMIYNTAIEVHGYTPEEARAFLPSHITHSGSLFINLRSLQQLFSKRSCWIAQNVYWSPFLTQIAQGLRAIDHRFSLIIAPPCIKADKWVGCPYSAMNLQRLDGKDPYVPCPLWYTSQVVEGGDPTSVGSSHELVEVINKYDDMLKELRSVGRGDYVDLAVSLLKPYEELWGRNVFVGADF